MNQPQSYGLIIEPPSETDYVAGDGKLSGEAGFSSPMIVAGRGNSKPHLVSMKNIVSRSTPFKIFHPIIQFVSVLVIDLRQFLTIFNERFSNKTMHRHHQLYPRSLTNLGLKVPVHNRHLHPFSFMFSEFPHSYCQCFSMAPHSSISCNSVPSF